MTALGDYLRFGPTCKPLKPMLVIHFRLFAVFTVSLPLFGFITCVFLSLVNDFDASTRTHCGVPNYLPSISAAVGGFSPQKEIWKLAIGLHAIPRFVIGYFFYLYLSDVLLYNTKYLYLKVFSSVLYTCENLGLIGLTFITSSDNYFIHKLSFITFIFCSQFNMLLTCYMLITGRNKPCKIAEAASRKLKFIFTVFNISCMFMACYFFYRHNKYCEPGVYSLFSMCEYLVVLSNMAFHFTAYYDFYGDMLSLRNFYLIPKVNTDIFY